MKVSNFVLLIISFVMSGNMYCQDYFELGKKEYFKGEVNKSIELFTRAIQEKQNVAGAYMMRGMTKGIKGDIQDGFKDLDSSKSLDPLNYKLYFYYGRMNYLKGDYKSALHYYDIAISKNKKDADLYDNRAIIKGMMNELKESIKDEDTAIAINPANNMYYTNRGFTRYKLKDYKNAVNDFSASLKLRPSLKAYTDRGYVYLELKEYQLAIEDLTNALSFNSNDYIVLYKRGIAYKLLGKKQDACADFKRSAELGYAEAVTEQKSTCP